MSAVTASDSAISTARAPLLPSSLARAALVEEVLDSLVEELGREGNEEEVAAARGRYDRRRGRVFEDEALWEEWTRAFLEWYIVERIHPISKRPLVARSMAAEADPMRAVVMRALITSLRSLFEIRAVRKEEVELGDILGGAHFSVSAEPLHGVSPGDVAELRLIGFDHEVFFGRTFLFHPGGTREAILAHARRIAAEGGKREEVIDYCASLRIRCERYRHVSPIRVYEAATADFPQWRIAGK